MVVVPHRKSVMLAVVDLALLLGMAFGGFPITGGDLGAVMHAVPRDADHRWCRAGPGAHEDQLPSVPTTSM